MNYYDMCDTHRKETYKIESSCATNEIWRSKGEIFDLSSDHCNTDINVVTVNDVLVLQVKETVNTEELHHINLCP